jgi:acyl carrier protein
LPSWTPESVLQEMQPIFQEVLDEPELTIERNSNSWNTPNWNSLAHIDLIETVERHFKVKFSLDQVQKFKEVGDLVDLVLIKVAKS